MSTYHFFTPSRPVQEPVQDCPPLSRRLSMDRLETVHGLSRQARTARKGDKYSPCSSKPRVTGGVVVGLSMAALCTIRADSWWSIRSVATWLLFAVAVAVGGDWLQMAGRSLAPQSRYLVTVITGILISCMYAIDWRYHLAATVVMGALLEIVALNNMLWLDAYNYEMSPEVMATITNADDTIAAHAWAETGKRRARTLMLSLGADFTETTLDGLFRPLYILGHTCGYGRGKAAAAEDVAEAQAERDVALANLEERTRERDKAEAELMELQAQTEPDQQQIRAQAAQIRALQTQIATLRAANAELVAASAADPEPEIDEVQPSDKIIKMPQEDPEVKATRLLRDGLSIRQTMQQVPELKKHQINKLQQAIRAEGSIAATR